MIRKFLEKLCINYLYDDNKLDDIKLKMSVYAHLPTEKPQIRSMFKDLKYLLKEVHKL